jgi:predicted DCC family thiol-disulfide oxidoreductase YuxK
LDSPHKLGQQQHRDLQQQQQRQHSHHHHLRHQQGLLQLVQEQQQQVRPSRVCLQSWQLISGQMLTLKWLQLL